jgi:pimeloyl-ACP methyl ester carboxylesterase
MATNDFARVGGTRFYYEIAGDGPPLVLVHAGIADGRMWDDQYPIFTRHYRVLRYDRRGFGKTHMAAGTYSHHQDLYTLLKFLNFGRAHLIGCSQGAKTIVDFTLEHPEMTESLILVSPALGGFAFSGAPPRQAQQLDLAEEAGDIDQVNELEMQIWVDGPNRTAEQVDPGMRERVREMNRIALMTPEDLGDEQALEPAAATRLNEILAPTLVIAGDIDTPRTLAASDFLAQQIAGAKKVNITGAAHLPNMEKVEEFNHLVLSFLSSLTS